MIRQKLILLALGLALISCAQKNEGTKIQEIDRFLAYHENLNKFNGTVLIAQGDRILLSKGYGYRDYENNVRNDTSSIFQIYSITKTFTSTLIFKLIEQNKLSLEDPLSKFYPSFPNGNNITIRHLLTHTSGINDDVEPDSPQTEAYRVAAFGKNKPHFAPGEGWTYCNGGYQLLGYMIQQLTGMSYEEAIRENIFQPLGMTKSGFDFKGLSRPEKTTAYHIFRNDTKEAAVLYDSAGPFAAGSIYSTVGDLYKYFKAIRSHSILSKASQGIAFTPGGKNKNYGYGWQLNGVLFADKVVFHSGGAAGFRSSFTMVPDSDVCVIILNNHENANPEYLTRKIIDILNDRPVELPREVKLEIAELKKMIGAFSLKEPRMMIYTSIIDGRLAIEVAGQSKTTIVATSENTFVQAEANATLEFIKDEEGVYSEFHIKQGSHKMVAKRIESSWGLIGDATSKGWDDTIPDIRFAEDKVRKGLWRLENITLKNGEIKFRLDNDWNIHYGDNNGDRTLDMYGKNIKVDAGVYDIILDLADETMPHYTISKKE